MLGMPRSVWLFGRVRRADLTWLNPYGQVAKAEVSVTAFAGWPKGFM